MSRLTDPNELGLVLPDCDSQDGLASNTAVVCYQTLILPPECVAILRECLSDDELARADRFHFQKDSDRFIITRAALRHGLGKLLNIAADEIQFEYGNLGKPYLPSGISTQNIEFNVTHSGVAAMLAYTLDSEIGVDIEQMRPMKDLLLIAQRYFSECEIANLLALPESIQQSAFFAIWSRKEALVKALGTGLTLPLSCFDVDVFPEEKSGSLLLAMRPTQARQTGERDDWQLYALQAPSGYKAAIAIRSPQPYEILTVGWTPEI